MRELFTNSLQAAFAGGGGLQFAGKNSCPLLFLFSGFGLGFPGLKGACLLIVVLNRTAGCVCGSSHYGGAAGAEKIISSAR